MSANPALVQGHSGQLVPAPFPNEVFVLKRDGMQCDLHGVQTRTHKWTTKGTLFLSNIRLVFVAVKQDESGLVAFDFPLVYMKKDKLNQPIFGCNNLSGQVWPAAEGGGPAGTLPPYDVKLYFTEGGIGTFYPLYYTLAERAKQAFAASQARAADQVNPPEYAHDLATHAFVDPHDPSTIYLTQPVGEDKRLPSAPKYAANYGQDEKYEDMGLRP